MNPPGVMRHFVKVKLYQVQLKIYHSKCFQISLKMIASCSMMFNLPNNQFLARLNISKKYFKILSGGQISNMSDFVLFLGNFRKIKIEFLENYLMK